MIKIKKVFTEVETDYGYRATNESYEAMKQKLNISYLYSVRLVEKTFDPETFTIEERVLRKAVCHLDLMSGKTQIIETVL